MSSTEKKPRLVSVNSILTDNDSIKRFRDAYTSQLPIHEKVIRLEHEPFSYCTIDDFVLDKNVDQFCSQLINELNNIKMNQKNNDLYKFQQSDDLTYVTLPAIEQIKFQRLAGTSN
ncbi:unnamed protein product [Rotaria sordida]|uniref:Uncharacterized protein n=1 Tax=Rotaria sordida TaxID=392033 RepID=A0A814AR20_9BILA|nr:unnamed protein product [Rotaria sordida]